MRVSSIWARANPIHMCGPRPNGSQAWSVMVFCSGVMSANRSGSKRSGSVHAPVRAGTRTRNEAIIGRRVRSRTVSRGPCCVPVISTNATTRSTSPTFQLTSKWRSENASRSDHTVARMPALVVYATIPFVSCAL